MEYNGLDLDPGDLDGTLPADGAWAAAEGGDIQTLHDVLQERKASLGDIFCDNEGDVSSTLGNAAMLHSTINGSDDPDNDDGGGGGISIKLRGPGPAAAPNPQPNTMATSGISIRLKGHALTPQKKMAAAQKAQIYLPPWDPTLFIGDGAGSDGGSSYNSGQSDTDDTTTQHISTSSISSPVDSTTSATSRTGSKEKKKTNKKKSKQSVRKSQIGAPVHFRHVEHGKTPEEEMFMASDGHQGSSQWTIQGPTPTTPPTPRKKVIPPSRPTPAAGTVVYALPQSPLSMRSISRDGDGGAPAAVPEAPLYATVNKNKLVDSSAKLSAAMQKSGGSAGGSAGGSGELQMHHRPPIKTPGNDVEGRGQWVSAKQAPMLPVASKGDIIGNGNGVLSSSATATGHVRFAHPQPLPVTKDAGDTATVANANTNAKPTNQTAPTAPSASATAFSSSSPSASTAPPAWYLKGQSRADLKAHASRLQTICGVGQFFIRDGVQSKGGAYALTVKFGGNELKNFLIKRTSEKKLRVRGHQLEFNSLRGLVMHYAESLRPDLGIQLKFDPQESESFSGRGGGNGVSSGSSQVAAGAESLSVAQSESQPQLNPQAQQQQQQQQQQQVVQQMQQQQQELKRQKKLKEQVMLMKRRKQLQQQDGGRMNATPPNKSGGSGSGLETDGGGSDSQLGADVKKAKQIERLAAKVVERLAARERGGHDNIDALVDKVAARIHAGGGTGMPSQSTQQNIPKQESLAQKKARRQFQKQQQQQQQHVALRHSNGDGRGSAAGSGGSRAADLTDIQRAALMANGRMTDMQRAAMMLTHSSDQAPEDYAPPEVWDQDPDQPYQYASERTAAAAVAAARKTGRKNSEEEGLDVPKTGLHARPSMDRRTDVQVAARMLDRELSESGGPPRPRYKSVSHAAASLGNPSQKKDSCLIC